jgi:pimeloyl-ACP methyl ester carboxylesterase
MALAVLDAGAGEPVLLLHGVPGSAATWAPVGDVLLRDFRLLVPDLLGFGRSSRPRSRAALATEAQVRTLAAALDELDVRDLTVVGHDLGATVAVLLAGERPDLVARLGLVAADTAGSSALLSGALAGRSTLLRLTRELAADPDAIAPDELVGDRRQARAVRLLAGQPPVDLAPLVAALDLPVTVVWGDDDPVAPPERARRLADTLPRARLVLVEGAGHLLPLERPAEVAHAIRDLVARGRGS